jgi:hypothetical protein
MEFLLTVPRSVILEREAEYKKQAALNPNRRGPKTTKKKRRGPGPAVSRQV